MGTIANAKVTHYYNCYNGDIIGCLPLFKNYSYLFVYKIPNYLPNDIYLQQSLIPTIWIVEDILTIYRGIQSYKNHCLYCPHGCFCLILRYNSKM